ncbi:MAG TPA: deoxyribonuclease V [Planctomycetota bacterium]|nr:deoxyribonuclease V [Planctomycetota bacterium]
MKLKRLGRWDVDYRGAVALQERLRRRLVRRGSPRGVQRVAGADVSYERTLDRFYAGVVVLSFPDLETVEEVWTSGRATFPYIPGLLTFREGPVLCRAFRALEHTPDLVIFDGQGVAHPRGIGLAAHMGLLVDVPSIGCAKSRLCGEHDAPGASRGASVPLRHGGRTVGRVVRTRDRVKPVFVSVGHRISLDAAVRWVLKTCDGFRLPEPTRRAHQLVNRIRKAAKPENRR